MTILVEADEREGEEYAVAARISASCVANSGLVCRRTFSFEEMCKCDNWRAPESANINGM